VCEINRNDIYNRRGLSRAKLLAASAEGGEERRGEKEGREKRERENLYRYQPNLILLLTPLSMLPPRLAGGFPLLPSQQGEESTSALK